MTDSVPPISLESISCDEKVDSPSSTPPNGYRNCTKLFWFSALAAGLGSGFQHGYALSIVANTSPIIKEIFGISDMYLSAIVSGNALGAIIGALTAGYLADKLGRRKAILVNTIFSNAGWILMACAPSEHVFLLGRILAGFGVGAGSSLSNIFNSEISHSSIRGSIGSLYGVFIGFGALVAYLITFPRVIESGDIGWRLAYAFPMIFVLFQDIIFSICPETPVYLAHMKSDLTSAVESLSKFRKHIPVGEVEDLKELAEKDESDEEVVSLVEILSDSGHRLALIIGVILHMTQQLSGISAVMSYTPAIFTAADVTDPVLASAGTGLVNLVTAAVAGAVADRAGRRLIMITGLVVMVISQIGIAVSQSCSGSEQLLGSECGGSWTGDVALVAMFVYQAGFAPSLGTVLWMYVTEITEPGARGKTNTICVTVNWILVMVVVFTYDSIDKALQPNTFFLFAAILSLLLVIIVLIMPETRKKNIREISEEVREQSQRIPPIVFRM